MDGPSPLSRIGLSILFLFFTSIVFSQVLINEIITEPQQSWSSGSFYNQSPGGTGIDGTDEWIELYITTSGLDLTSWTIELFDGTDVSGDLTSSGAFEVSNYLSTTGGSFTDTDAGDYIILGNVSGAGSMDNTGLTVNLKNSIGTIIDQVLVGASAPSGNSTSTADESVARIPGETDTGDNSVDFTLTVASLGITNSTSGTVKINEIVADPQQDWSSISFIGAAPGGTGTNGSDEWIELYIETSGINLAGWTIDVNDGTDFSGDLTNTGAFDVVNYIGSGSFVNTQSGDYLILGDPDGTNSMNEGTSITIILRDPTGTIIDQVTTGGGAGQAPSGDASSTSDESISRYSNATDTDTDDLDFIQTIASLGGSNSVTGTVLINEIVTNPQQDWSTNSFNGFVGSGSVDEGTDEWVELYIGTAGINLTGWTIQLTDGTNVSGDLTSTGAFDVSNYSGTGSFLNTAVGDYLVLGTVDGGGSMDDDSQITLLDATGTIVDQIKLGGGLGEAPSGLSTGISDESVARIPNATDTDADDSDFSKAEATIGGENFVAPLPSPGYGLDFSGDSDDYVNVSDDPSLEMTGDFTIEFWLKTAVAGNNIIIEKGTANSEYSVQQSSTDKIILNINGIMETNSSYNDGNWHHVAVVYRGATDGTIYVDGIDDTNVTNGLGTPTYSTGDLTMGNRAGSSTLSIEGVLDEVRIWEDERTQEEVLENMFTTLEGTETGLVSYYNFDQNAGTSLPDVAGSNDGTLTNMTGSEWTTTDWDIFADNAAIVQLNGGTDITPAISAELTLTDVGFLNDDGDFVLIGHQNGDFSEIATDLPAGTLVTARYDRNWHVYLNDETGTTGGNVSLSFDIGATPDVNYTYYLLERAGTSGDFSIAPAAGINPSGTSLVFTIDAANLTDGSYYTLGRSGAGVGNALDFDGTDDYVTITDDDAFSFGDGSTDTPFTIETWINPGTVASRTIVSKLVGGFDEWEMSLSAGGQLQLILYDDSAPADLTGSTSGFTFNTSQWYHVAVVYDGGSLATGIRLFIDGVEYANSSSTSGTYTAMENLSSAVEIGTSNTGTNNFDGIIDELRIWNDERTQAELIANMYQNLAGDEANLVAYYRMNQGIGDSNTNLPDLSGGSNNGTLASFDNLGNATATSNYVTSDRIASEDVVYIVNAAVDVLTNTSDELTISSTTSDFLQDTNDQVIWGNDGGAFSETTADVPTGTLVTNRINKTWYVRKNDVVGTANGNMTFSFDLGATPDPDLTYYLLSRSGVSGEFSVVEVIGTVPSGNSMEFTVDGAEVTDENYFTIGRSDVGEGNALIFDGSDDIVTITPTGTEFDLSGQDFTLEVWATPASVSTGDAWILSKNDNGNSNIDYLLGRNTANWFFKMIDNGNTVTSATTITVGTFYHVAVVVDQTASTMELYVNGEKEATSTISGAPNIAVNPLVLGNWSSSSNKYFEGELDEVRIWNDARTDDEIRANAFKHLDVANESDLLLYFKFNQGIPGGDNSSPPVDLATDFSGNNKSGVLSGFALTGTTSNWIASEAIIVDKEDALALQGPGNALDFDGTDDYVVTSDAAALDITGSLTLEAWVNLGTTPPSANEGIVSKFLTAGNQESYTLDVTTGGNIAFTVTDDGSTDVTATSTSTLTISTWTHVAVVFTPSTSMEIFVDGVLDTKLTTGVPASIHSGSADLWIGVSSVLNANNSINAIIDEVRIWNTARTATEIQDAMFKQLVGDETGLATYYQFDELPVASTTTLPDKTANGNDGTLTNMDPANDWVDAAPREPFKTVESTAWNTASTWKSSTVPNATTAKIDVTQDITLDTTVDVDDLNINSGVTLTIAASQTLTVNGNVINNGTITGAGTLLLDTGTPIITGGTLGNVTVNGANPELQGTTTMTGTLSLTNGILSISEFDLNLTGSVSGGSSASYISTLDQAASGGFVRRTVANGAGPIVFPIGTSNYTPFTMLNLGSSADFRVRVFNGTYAQGTYGNAHVTDEEVNRTWDINTLGSGYNTTITLQWNATDEDLSFDRTNMFVSRNTFDGMWRTISGTFAASGADPYTATVSGVNSFSQIAAGSGSSPLPVDLVDFSVKNDKGRVLLEWTTASEFNNDYFEIQRSADGENFEVIGLVDGSGDSNSLIDYAFTDANPHSGINYYRLRQVDFDGAFEYSSVRVVNVDTGLESELTVFPNPSNNGFTLLLNGFESSEVQLSLIDYTGKLIRQSRFNTQGGRLQVEFGAELSPGLYLLVAESKGQRLVSRIMKK